jgi:hypothetical protein
MTSAGHVDRWRRADLATCGDLDRFGHDERVESSILGWVSMPQHRSFDG